MSTNQAPNFDSPEVYIREDTPPRASSSAGSDGSDGKASPLPQIPFLEQMTASEEKSYAEAAKRGEEEQGIAEEKHRAEASVMAARMLFDVAGAVGEEAIEKSCVEDFGDEPSAKKPAKKNPAEQALESASKRVSEDVPRCQQAYIKSGNSKPLLLIMAYGWRSDIDPFRVLGDCENEPYKSLGKSHKPKLPLMREEIKRRFAVLSANLIGIEHPVPKPAGWKMDKCKAWLARYPVRNAVDVAWLKAEEQKYYDTVVAAQEAKNGAGFGGGGGGGGGSGDSPRSASWTTNEPYLRLYCCAMDDKAREAFCTKDDALTREKLDGRNSSYRPTKYEEIVASLYNNENNVYVTDALPDLHEDFKDPIELPFNERFGKISLESCKDRLANTRAILVKIVPNFEQSGMGFGSRNADEAGTVNEEIIHEAGDRRANFLGNWKSHVLYYWHLSDKHGILSRVLSTLDKAVASDSSAMAPSLSSVENPRSSKKKKKDSAEEEDRRANSEARRAVSSALANISYGTLHQSIMQLDHQLADLELRRLSTTPGDGQYSILGCAIDRVKKQLKPLRAKAAEYDEDYNGQRETAEFFEGGGKPPASARRAAAAARKSDSSRSDSTMTSDNDDDE